MQRQPLTEQSARREAFTHGTKVLDGIQRARAAARRVEVVGDDHVIALGCRTHESARVGRDELEARVRCVAEDIVREEAGRRDDLRQQLHGIDGERGILRSRHGGDAGAEAKEQRAPRRRMQ